MGANDFKADHLKTEPTAAKKPLVWDLPVRIFHWTLLLAFVAAFVTNRLGVTYFQYHVWSGYTVIVLVVFRIVWGIIGTRHARFWNFVRGPVTTWRYVAALRRGSEHRYAGHNPLGALMVILLLGTVLIQALTGLFGNDEIFNVGPLYAYVSNELSLRLTSLHRQLFYWIAGAVGVHVLAVFLHYALKRENLVAAMITGRKPSEHIDTTEHVHSSRAWLALMVVVGISAALAWVVLHAPVPVSDPGY